MGFFDEAKEAFDKAGSAMGDAFDKGVAATKDVVSSVAVEQHASARGMVRLCTNAAAKGWHEANGGNVSLRLTPDQVEQCRGYFYTTPGEWVALDTAVPEMGGETLLITGTGVLFREVADDVARHLGIIEIAPDGSAWRVVWGFKDGGRPTSELAAHLGIYAARLRAGLADVRVVYHAHPANLIALTGVEPATSRDFTRALWKTLAECIIVAPRGVELVPWYAPGTADLAQACADALVSVDAVVALCHGVFVASASLDGAFNLVETLDKVAGVRLSVRAARAGAEPLACIPDEGLRQIAERYGLAIRDDWIEN